MDFSPLPSHLNLNATFTHMRGGSLQSVSPSFTYPDGQSPHVLPPIVLVHVLLLSHPPLFFRHSFTSLQPVSPSFTYPDGQLPHVLPPIVLVHVLLLSHPPLLLRHSFTSLQPVSPSFTYP